MAFPPPHDYRGLHINIKGSRIKLNSQQEEMAYAWAKKKGTQYFDDSVFASNFLVDFRKTLPKEYSKVETKDLDFSEILRHQEKEKERVSQPDIRKHRSAERKRVREELKARYGYTKIDGKLTEVANWMVEPPGLFIGRGGHPMRGRWKPRIYDEDVTLNLGREASMAPGKWGRVADHTSMWLARWIDKLTGKEKYVWLHDSASLRQERDKLKYEYAEKLAGKIGRLRKHIQKGMSSKNKDVRAIAVVCYLIDRLAMRVGDEKDEDEADTVGASTLRVEHVELTRDTIYFDFLGKDSVRWQKTLRLDGVGNPVLKIFDEFLKGKRKDELLFDGISSNSVNRFLVQAMPGLTAKVFRTFHSTAEVTNYLKHHDILKNSDFEYEKIYQAKLANLQAAIRCNHKKTLPKNWDESLAKKEERLKTLLTHKPKTERAHERLMIRIKKQRLTIDLAKKTKEYNLNTSLRNYIDPRVYKAWSNHVNLDLGRIYPKSLHRKISWTNRTKVSWERLKR